MGRRYPLPAPTGSPMFLVPSHIGPRLDYGNSGLLTPLIQPLTSILQAAVRLVLLNVLFHQIPLLKGAHWLCFLLSQLFDCPRF